MGTYEIAINKCEPKLSFVFEGVCYIFHTLLKCLSLWQQKCEMFKQQKIWNYRAFIWINNYWASTRVSNTWKLGKEISKIEDSQPDKSFVEIQSSFLFVWHQRELVYKSAPWTPGRQCLIYYWVEWFVQFSKALKSIANTAHIKITNTQHWPEKGEAWTFFGKGSGFNTVFFSSNISMYAFANTLHQNKMLLSWPANKTITHHIYEIAKQISSTKTIWKVTWHDIELQWE